ncbi:MAG: Fe-S cluster assembly protein SufD [Myxococcota bacterium]
MAREGAAGRGRIGMNDLERARDHWLASALAFAAGRPAGEPPWIETLRAEAAGELAAAGLPSRRLEEWRYTNVTPIARGGFEPAPPGHAEISRPDVEGIAFPVFACSLFVFVNGRFEPGLSAPSRGPGLRVESLAQALANEPDSLASQLGRIGDPKGHPFAALNTAFLEDGAVVSVPAGIRAEQPIHLVFVSAANGTPTLSQPRVLVVAERGSQAVVIQDHVSLGPGPGLTNAVTEVLVGPDAGVDLVIVQRESDEQLHVSNVACRQERNSRLSCHTLTLGGAWVRNDLASLLMEEGAETRLDGLFVGAGDQLVDNHTLVDHAAPHCASQELYKGILGGRARGIFRGRVVVRPGAQKTDARQSNPNVLLCDGAEIDTKPQLEIHADDVRCSHGSSIGCLDPEALYYLRSRGIGERSARELLTRGFAAEILSRLPSDALADSLGEVLPGRLRSAGGAP